MTSEAERTGGAANVLQGDFGEAWLAAIAAGSGLLQGRPSTLDLDKADVQLTLPESTPGTYFPTVKVQVKTTLSLRSLENGDFSYDLDVSTFNILRRTDHMIPRILVVIGLFEGEKVQLVPEGTLLAGRGAWTSLEGAEETSNTDTVAVHLSSENTLDRVGLNRMLRTHGVRRSTPVPEVNPWSGGE